MKDFCNIFVLSYEGKTVETLWLEFKKTLYAGIGKFIPSKFVGEKSLCHGKHSLQVEKSERETGHTKHL